MKSDQILTLRNMQVLLSPSRQKKSHPKNWRQTREEKHWWKEVKSTGDLPLYSVLPACIQTHSLMKTSSKKTVLCGMTSTS